MWISGYFVAAGSFLLMYFDLSWGIIIRDGCEFKNLRYDYMSTFNSILNWILIPIEYFIQYQSCEVYHELYHFTHSPIFEEIILPNPMILIIKPHIQTIFEVSRHTELPSSSYTPCLTSPHYRLYWL